MYRSSLLQVGSWVVPPRAVAATGAVSPVLPLNGIVTIVPAVLSARATRVPAPLQAGSENLFPGSSKIGNTVPRLFSWSTGMATIPTPRWTVTTVFRSHQVTRSRKSWLSLAWLNRPSKTTTSKSGPVKVLRYAIRPLPPGRTAWATGGNTTPVARAASTASARTGVFDRRKCSNMDRPLLVAYTTEPEDAYVNDSNFAEVISCGRCCQ